MRTAYRFVAVLAAVMAVFLSSCADTGLTERESPASAGGQALFTVGILGQASPPRSSYINIKLVVEAAGGRLITEDFDPTPDGSIKGVEKLIAAGCDGIIFIPQADSSLSFVTGMCEDAGVYWVISMRTIHDARIRQQVEASPYYVGMVMEDDESVGYNLVSVLAEQGAQKLAVLSIQADNTTGAARERGMSRAVAEYGIDVVSVIRNLQGSDDIAAAVESLMKAHPDLDAIYSVSGASVIAMETIMDAGRSGQIRYATSDLGQSLGDFFDQGMLSAATGGHIPIDSCMAAVLLVNTLRGTPIGMDGPVTLVINPLMIRTGDELREYYSTLEDGLALFSAEAAKQKMMKWINPGVSAESLQGIIDSYSIESILEWKADQVSG